MSTILTSSLVLPSFSLNATENQSRVEVEPISGLRGTYFLNGPAKFHFDDLSYNHWLDGDGMVTAIRFGEGDVRTTSKYVKGKKFVTESTKGKPVFRTFGTSFDGDRLYRGTGTASPYNVSVFRYQDRLLAFGEQSLPMELNLETLETATPRRTFDFDRQLNEASPFSAHPKIDEHTGELLNFGVFFDDKRPLLIYYRFDAEGKLVCKAKHEIDLPCSLHDFATSENYVVFYLSPHLLRAERLLRNRLPLSQSLDWCPNDHSSRLMVLCRATGVRKAEIRVGNKYNLHTIDCFEQDNRLYLDVIEYDRPLYDQYETLPNLFVDTSPGVPTRFEIDVNAGNAERQVMLDFNNTPDFPVALDRASVEDEFWVLGISNWNVAGPKFYNQLAHLSWRSTTTESDVWTAPTGWFMAGEPAIAHATNGEALLITPLFDATNATSHVGIFLARRVADGPVQLIELGHQIPLGFHSTFCSDQYRC